MNKLTTIEIRKEYFHFSAAHFTIFNATERERLHGHNFRVGVAITGEVDDNGLCFDYAIYKKILEDLCVQYDEYTLIAEDSPYLSISHEDDTYYYIKHHESTLILIKEETILLPVLNVTIEELSHYFLNVLVSDSDLLERLKIHEFELRVSSGPNQWGVAQWSRRADGPS